MGYTIYPHAEMPGSPKENASIEKGGGFTADVDLMVPWNYRNSVAADIVGNCQLYPRIPASGARAVSAAISPIEAATKQLVPGMAAYDFAKVSIKYKLQAETSDFVSESLEPSAEFITLPPDDFARGGDLQDAVKQAKDAGSWTSYTYGNAGDDTITTIEYPSIAAPPDAPEVPDIEAMGFPPTLLTLSQDTTNGHSSGSGDGPGRLMKKWDYIITFHRVITLPNSLQDLIDCVNQYPIPTKLLGMTWAPETVSFNPPSAKRRWNYTTIPYWELTYKFTYQPGGWNMWWNPKLKNKDGTTGGYDYLYTRGPHITTKKTDSYGTDVNLISTTWYKYRNFPLADFAPAFALDMNLSPWADPNSPTLYTG